MPHCCAPQGGSGDLSKPAELTERRWLQFLWAASLPAILVRSLLVGVRLALFPLGFIIAGLLCIPNAAAWGRLHCYITGPLFLIAGVVSAVRDFDVVVWSWNLIGLGVLLGVVLGYLPACFVGNYMCQHGG